MAVPGPLLLLCHLVKVSFKDMFFPTPHSTFPKG